MKPKTTEHDIDIFIFFILLQLDYSICIYVWLAGWGLTAFSGQ